MSAESGSGSGVWIDSEGNTFMPFVSNLQGHIVSRDALVLREKKQTARINQKQEIGWAIIALSHRIAWYREAIGQAYAPWYPEQRP